MQHGDDGAEEEEGVEVGALAAPSAVQWHQKKKTTALELHDRPARPEGPGGRGFDRRTVTVALGRSERVRDRGKYLHGGGKWG